MNAFYIEACYPPEVRESLFERAERLLSNRPGQRWAAKMLQEIEVYSRCGISQAASATRLLREGRRRLKNGTGWCKPSCQLAAEILDVLEGLVDLWRSPYWRETQADSREGAKALREGGRHAQG